MNASAADWLRFASIALSALNIGWLAGLARVYYRSMRSGDTRLIAPAKILALLALGIVLVFGANAWAHLRFLGGPVSLPLLVLPVGYSLTLYGFARLHHGMSRKFRAYVHPQPGRHSNSA